MKHSVAVINPSLFEGWSTSVEESKSLGVACVLSDIPVHKEQAPDRGVFFEARNPNSLAEALIKVLEQFATEAENRHRAQAAALLPERLGDFGTQYQAIVLQTLRKN